MWLFLLAEVALYALDVYYNNTFTGQRFGTRDDQNNPDDIYANYQYPAYYDAYQNTLKRGFDGPGKDFGSWKNLAKIPHWLNLAYEM